jgi:hypothetical protein
MFEMSADDTGWLITIILAVAVMAVVAGVRRFWR